MYDPQKAHQTVMDLRNTALSIRANHPENIDLIQLELLLSRSMIDMSAAVDTITELGKENAALREQVAALVAENEAMKPVEVDESHGE